MATIGGTLLTLNDWAKRMDPDGTVADVAELLSQDNEILDDMLWKEGNLPTGERVTQRTGLPTAYYRLMNMGTPNSKSSTAQVDEQTAMLNIRTQIDQDEAELNGNVTQYRMDESQASIEGMNQSFASTLFYGSNANPEEFVGYAPRFNDLGAANGQNIIDALGSQSDNSSIWLIGWGNKSTYGIFPKGSKVGLSHEDLGLGDAFDSNNDRFRAYMDAYKWKQGIAVKNWQYIVRIANIDISTLIADPTGSTTNLLNYMVAATHTIKSLNGVKPVFYCNRTINKMLDTQAMNKSNVHLTVGEEEGKRKLSLRGIPIKMVDALTETEARVV
jgi:hypothetical protein